MKVVISGPRRLPRKDPGDPWPHMHIELDLPVLPAVGEVIILNSGSSYVVRRRMWWVDGPENEAYWSHDGDYSTSEGRYQVAYLDVLPSGYDEPFTYSKAIEEGETRGREQAAAEVEGLLDLMTGESHVGPLSAIGLLRNWCREGAVAARKREEDATRHAALAREILDQLQAEREEIADNKADRDSGRYDDGTWDPATGREPQS